MFLSELYLNPSPPPSSCLTLPVELAGEPQRWVELHKGGQIVGRFLIAISEEDRGWRCACAHSQPGQAGLATAQLYHTLTAEQSCTYNYIGPVPVDIKLINFWS